MIPIATGGPLSRRAQRIARLRQKTVEGLSATTVAERGAGSTEVISPTTSPGTISDTGTSLPPSSLTLTAKAPSATTEAVEVWIEVEDAAEALDEGCGPGMAVVDARLPAPQALPGEKRTQERPEHFCQKSAVYGEEKPQVPREGEHPLAVRGLGQDAVDQKIITTRCPASALKPLDSHALHTGACQEFWTPVVI